MNRIAGVQYRLALRVDGQPAVISECLSYEQASTLIANLRKAYDTVGCTTRSGQHEFEFVAEFNGRFMASAAVEPMVSRLGVRPFAARSS